MSPGLLLKTSFSPTFRCSSRQFGTCHGFQLNPFQLNPFQLNQKSMRIRGPGSGSLPLTWPLSGNSCLFPRPVNSQWLQPPHGHQRNSRNRVTRSPALHYHPAFGFPQIISIGTHTSRLSVMQCVRALLFSISQADYAGTSPPGSL